MNFIVSHSWPQKFFRNIIWVVLPAALFFSCLFRGPRPTARSVTTLEIMALEQKLTAATIQLLAISAVKNPRKYAEQRRIFEAALAEYLAVTGKQKPVTLRLQARRDSVTIVLPVQIVAGEHLPFEITRSDTAAIAGEEMPLELHGEILDLALLPGNNDSSDHVVALFADSILALPWPLTDSASAFVYRFTQKDLQTNHIAAAAGLLYVDNAESDGSARILALATNLKSALMLHWHQNQFHLAEASGFARNDTLPLSWRIEKEGSLFYAPEMRKSFRSLRRLPDNSGMAVLDEAGYLNLFSPGRVQPLWRSERPWGSRLFLLPQNLIAVCDRRQSAFVVFQALNRELRFLGQSPGFENNPGALTPVHGEKEGILVSTVAGDGKAGAVSRLHFFSEQTLPWNLPVNFDLPQFQDYEASVTFLQNERNKIDGLEGYYLCPPVVWSNLVETLYRSDEDGEIRPLLASGMHADSTWQEWKISLRPDVHFSDGTRMTAPAVRESWQQNWRDCTKNSCALQWLWANIEGAHEFAAGKREHVTGLQVVDEYTLKVRLNIPRRDFAEHLMQPCFSVIKRRPEKKALVGTGPFRLHEVSHDRSGSLLLCRRNDYYHGGPAPLKEIKFVLHKANMTEVMLNLNATGTAIRRKKEIEFFHKIDQMAVRPIATQPIYFLALNPAAPPLAELSHRRRIATALEREVLPATMNAAETVPASNFFSAPAADLFAQENDRSPRIRRAVTISFRAEDEAARQIAERLAVRLAQLKISHRAPQALSESAFVKMRRSGKYEILVDSYWPVFASATYNLTQLLQRGYVAEPGLVAGGEQALASPLAQHAGDLERTLIEQAMLHPLVRVKNYAVLPAQLAEVKLDHMRQIDFARAWLPLDR